MNAKPMTLTMRLYLHQRQTLAAMARDMDGIRVRPAAVADARAFDVAAYYCRLFKGVE